MSKILLLLFFIFIYSCSPQTKTVLICGDHICINKDEANQYFEDNLQLEVRIIDTKKNEDIDLVELNLRENLNKKSIKIKQKSKTNKKIKILNQDEIKKIKKKIKLKKNNKKIVKDLDLIKENKNNVALDKEIQFSNNILKKKIMYPTDICTILDKCSIDEISKYLVKKGKKMKFPDITERE